VVVARRHPRPVLLALEHGPDRGYSNHYRAHRGRIPGAGRDCSPAGRRAVVARTAGHVTAAAARDGDPWAAGILPSAFQASAGDPTLAVVAALLREGAAASGRGRESS